MAIMDITQTSLIQLSVRKKHTTTNVFTDLACWTNICSYVCCFLCMRCGEILQMLLQLLSLKSLEPIKIWRCYWPFIPKGTPDIMPCSKWKVTDWGWIWVSLSKKKFLKKILLFRKKRINIPLGLGAYLKTLSVLCAFSIKLHRRSNYRLHWVLRLGVLRPIWV